MIVLNAVLTISLPCRHWKLLGLVFFSSAVLSATLNFLADVCDIVFMLEFVSE